MKDIRGLSSEEVEKLTIKYGKNELFHKKKQNLLIKILHTIIEPMFLFLLITSIIYFALGEQVDGITMLVFVIFIIGIDVIQEFKTDKTLSALASLSAPKIKVIRDGITKYINSKDLVPGDMMLLSEGNKIPADGKIKNCSGFLVDESTLTGESLGIFKSNVEEDNDEYFKNNYCYAGTLVLQGTAIVEVKKTGINTEYGKIGVDLISIKEEKSNLQKQIDSLVRVCALIAFILFILVSIFTYINISNVTGSKRLIESILSGITLAMAMIPEEFPVILTVFLSLGAFRLAKNHALVKKLSSVETLGAISVLCVDKTGTITKNEMTISETWPYNVTKNDLYETMGLCCMENTYDPMEKAILNYCKKLNITSDHLYSGTLLKEYPFNNNSKTMGICWNHDEKIIVTAKGSPENIIKICSLDKNKKDIIIEQIDKLTNNGLRVIAVAQKELENSDLIKLDLSEYKLNFCGLIGFVDPPRENINKSIASCISAGIKVIMITGDNGNTAINIAKSVGISDCDSVITGDEIDKLSIKELSEKVKNVSVFSRVKPEHKMKIVKCLKNNGEIVAMTGDGVNDAPALKLADIGIAMGKKGSEVSRESADLILMDDNFETIVNTIEDGRRIYDNIKKAVGYIFIIHIPIALSSLFAPILGISPANVLLLPLHIVLLELIIDPTCSIVLERQPKEANTMNRPPRKQNSKILDLGRLIKSLTQGLVVFVASFLTYYLCLRYNLTTANVARSLGIVIIMLSNLFLVQVNSSDIDFVYITIKKLIYDKVMWCINIFTILGIIAILYLPINKYLKLSPLTLKQLLLTVVISFISVFWYELVKLIRNKR